MSGTPLRSPRDQCRCTFNSAAFLDPPAADLAAGLGLARRTPARTAVSELGQVFDGRRVTPRVRSSCPDRTGPSTSAAAGCS